MNTVYKKLAGAALAGTLMAGTFAGPAVAGEKHDDHDGKINVIVYKDKDNDKNKKTERKNLTIKEATKFAAEKCDVKPKSLVDEAWKAEYLGKARACKMEKNKKTKVYVWFVDNDDNKKKDDKGKGGKH